MQRFLYLLLLMSVATAVVGQGTQTTFGKNRVQYHRNFDEWMQYESDNFITFWYGDGRRVAESVVQLAEYDFDHIQSILEHRINDKIEILVYVDITDVKQSNIGAEETFNNIGGQTKIVGNKVFVYFNGDHNNLRKQVREGIAEVYLTSMLFGSNLQEIVQNAVMLNLPDWFKQGLVAYIGEEWNSDLDNQLKDAILDEEYEGFETLAEQQPKLVGHALWYFISENYGSSTVSNLLYLTRINRSIESGFLYVLGSPYNVVINGWENYFKERYKLETGASQKPEKRTIKIRNKHNLPISQLKVSPDGKKIIYVTNEIGKTRVYLQDLRTGDRKTILKNGFRNAFQATDYNYPMVAWNTNNSEIGIIYERRDVIKMKTYDVFTEESETIDLPSEFQRVNSMEYVNPVSLVVSGTVRGYSDIFLYFTNTRQTQRITNDFYDDLDATFVKMGEQQGILFASNRQDSLLRTEKLDTILPVNTFDLFFYDMGTRSKELVRITNTPLANERQPVAVDSTYFSFLSDESGIYNRQMGYLEEYIHHYEQLILLEDGTEIILHADSSLASLDTTLIDTIQIRPVVKQRSINHSNSNYNRNIIEQHTSPKTGRLVELVYRNGSYQAFTRMLNPTAVVRPIVTRYQAGKIAYQRSIQQTLVPSSSNFSPPTVPPPPPPATENTVLKEVEEQTVKEIELPAEKQDTGKVDIDNYFFQSEFDDEEEEIPVTIIEKEKIEEQQPVVISTEIPVFDPDALSVTPEKKVHKFRPGRITPYRLKFRTDYVTTQLDNSLLFEGRESYLGNPDGFGYPPPGILLKANFKDLFEDYEIEGGIRLPTTFNGAEYFLVFNDKKHRLDKTYALYRRNQRFSEPADPVVPGRSETNILLGQFGLRYPLDIFRSLRLTTTLRRDRAMFLATERNPLERPVIREQRIGVKLEYVFDNTLDVALNIKNGTRYKVYVEFLKRFELNLIDEVSFDFGGRNTGIIGFDFRHYQRLLKHSIIAVRAAGAASFGSEQMLFFLGGVDNQVLPQPGLNQDIPIPQNGSFAFQTIATNLRGFEQNIRNGSSYALINTELRMPIFKYFSKNIKSNFLRNFQLVGFFDIGTAWEGFSPYDDDNPLNTSFFQNGPNVEVKVNFFRDPLVAGYGAGVRSMLFGYFIRVDYAWGIETRQVQDPVWHLSIGTDF
ncbi:MAG: hypothetical protein AAF798_06665 [Bacteroidota bacterium]